MAGALVTSNPAGQFSSSTGLFANRPTKSVNGRFYFASDVTDATRFSVWIGSKAAGSWVSVPPVVFATMTISALTSGRIPVAAAAGLLADFAGLTFDGNDLLIGRDLVATRDLIAAGGFKRDVGPFTVTLAASQTALVTAFGGVAGSASYIVKRAGSILGISGMIDGAITGAGTTAAFSVFKNGVVVDTTLKITFTQAGGETFLNAVVAKDAFTVAALDKIDIRYTSTGISNTPKFWGTVELEE